MKVEENVYEETTLTEDVAEANEKGALTVLGKFKDVGALVRAYESLQAEFTRRSQKLRQLEREADNFKEEKGLPSGAEKLCKAVDEKGEGQENCAAFVADMVCPSVEEMKSDQPAENEQKPQGEGVENEEKSDALVTEKDAKLGEVKTPSVVGDKAQGVTDDLFERAVNDEAVRLRIIGEYLSSIGKSNAPLTAVGGGTFAAPPMKAKTVGEAGNMALLYFRKPNL